jgi:DNA-binding NarL/FixJ family response regulator
MGGREATERILELDPQAKVVAMSGYCNDSVMSEHTRYGFRASVSKPFHAAQLSKVLREVIEESCVTTR